jgi:phosphatidylglycerophosphate synthase
MYLAATATAHHVRVHKSVLASAEKRLLVWIATRLPAAVTSDHLSALSLAAMGGAALSFAAFRVTPWAALGVVVSLILNWFGDSLDGTLARVRDQQRPRYGFYVDHVIDITGTALLMAGLGCSGLMNPLIAAGLLAAYLLVSSESYLATHASGVFRMSFLGVGPTELRILIAAGAIKVAATPWILVGGTIAVRLFDLGGVIGGAGLAIAFAVSSIRNTRALFLAEPIPDRTRRIA